MGSSRSLFLAFPSSFFYSTNRLVTPYPHFLTQSSPKCRTGTLVRFSVARPTDFKTWKKDNSKINSQWSQDELCTSLSSLVRLRKVEAFKVPDDYLKSWYRNSLHHLAEFESKRFAKNIWSLAKLGEAIDPEFFRRWMIEAQKNLNRFETFDLVCSLWSISVIDVSQYLFVDSSEVQRRWINPKFVQKAFNVLTHRSDLGEIDLHQLFLVSQYMESVLNLPLKVSERLQAKMKGALEHIRTSSQITSSQLQKDIVETFKEILTDEIYEEVWSEDSGSFVDILLLKQKLMIQVDGPHHFIKEGNHREFLSPNHHLLNSIWESKGWRVIRLSYRDWQNLPRLEQRQAFLLRLVER